MRVRTLQTVIKVLYDSCLESVLESLLLSLIFHPEFQKLSSSSLSILKSGLICCSPLFPYLPQPSVTVGPLLPSISFEKILKLILSHIQHFPGWINSFLLSSVSCNTFVEPVMKESTNVSFLSQSNTPWNWRHWFLHRRSILKYSILPPLFKYLYR